MKRYSSSIIGLVLCAAFMEMPVAAQPVQYFGLSLSPIGQATVSHPTNNSLPAIANLSCNGQDGVRIHLGEADNGVYFSPDAYPENGNTMRVRAYGRLRSGTNMQLICSIGAGRASERTYPLNVDLSGLGSTSYTFQVYYDDQLVGEVPEDWPFVTAEYHPGPRANPFVRRPDGSVGAQLDFTSSVMFVFPEALASFTGTRIFIRANHPTNDFEVVSQVDVFGGGGLPSFAFTDLRLGMFGRPHKLLESGTFEATNGMLRIHAEPLAQTGAAIELERLSALELDVQADLSVAHSYLILEGIGCSGGQRGITVGGVEIRNTETNYNIYRFVPELSDPTQYITNVIVAFFNSNVLVLETNQHVQQMRLSAPLETRLQGAYLRAKTVESLPGAGIRFQSSTTLNFNGATITADEVRFVMPEPILFEFLETAVLLTRLTPPLTILAERGTPRPDIPPLHVARAGTNLIVSWPDPNLLYQIELNDHPLHLRSWRVGDYSTLQSNRYSHVIIPPKTNHAEYFRLSRGRRGD